MKKALLLSAAMFVAPLFATSASASENQKVDVSSNIASLKNSKSMGKYFTKESLIGRWDFTTMQSCSRSKPGAPGTVAIDPNTLKFNTPVDVIQMSGSGSIAFNRDGTFEMFNGNAAEFDQSNLAVGATPVNNGFFPNCKGTYDVTARNLFNVTFNCVIDVPSQGIEIHAGPVLTDGIVAINGDSATMNLHQNVQTLTALVHGNPVGERQRVCLQTFNLVKLSYN